MNEMKLLEDIRRVKLVGTRPKFKKRSKESNREYLIKKANYTCTYCGLPKKKEELCIIKKNHSLQEHEIFEKKNNKVVSCKGCSSKKQDMNHYEFKKFLLEERKQNRKEIFENYKEIAPKIFEKYEYKCIYCEYEYGFTKDNMKLTIDHKLPLSRGGSNEIKNLACSCEFHNYEKGSMTTNEYFDFLEKQNRKHNKK